MFTTFPVKPRTPTTDVFKPRTPTKDSFKPRTPTKDSFKPRTPTKDSFKPRTPTSDVFPPRTPTSDGFPTTPVIEHSHSAFRPSSPKQTKQSHRVARIYQPGSPTLPPRPSTAHLQPERPTPLLSLPGLPPQELPRSILPPPQRKFKFARILVDNSRSFVYFAFDFQCHSFTCIHLH